MIKWEYLTMFDISDNEGELDRLGLAGWELVAVDSRGAGYFKRDAAIGVEMEAETRYGN